MLCHPLTHGDRHTDRAKRVIFLWDRVVEPDHHTIAREMLEGPFVAEHRSAHGLVIVAKHRKGLLRLGGLREGRKAAEVAKDDADLATMWLQQRFLRQHELGDLRRQEPPQPANALDLLDLVPNATLEHAIPF